jgi:hypothetical protein
MSQMNADAAIGSVVLDMRLLFICANLCHLRMNNNPATFTRRMAAEVALALLCASNIRFSRA